jgi:hypothetical protein
LDGICVYVRALGELADEPKRLVLTINEPPVGVKTCVFNELCISFSKLRTCCRTRGVIQGQANHIQQIRTFLVHKAVHNRLEFHRDQRAWFRDMCDDLRAGAFRADCADSQGRGGLDGPGMRKDGKSIGFVLWKVSELGICDFDDVDLYCAC